MIEKIQHNGKSKHSLRIQVTRFRRTSGKECNIERYKGGESLRLSMDQSIIENLRLNARDALEIVYR
jgi:hypothetical protein